MIIACADPEGGTGVGIPPPPLPEKSQKYRVFYQYRSRSPEKITATKPAFNVRPHLVAFRWRADDGRLIVLLRSFPHQLKKKKEKKT